MSKHHRKYFLFVFILFMQSVFFLAFSEAKQNKKYDLVICAIFQNEEFFLKEWIEFHKLVGVQHFYLYDNGSTDRSLQILRPYIKTGEVDLIPWGIEAKNHEEYNRGVQIPAYQHALGIVKNTAKWAAFIDVDEFICPVQEKNLVKFLRNYSQYGGLAVNWQNYGTSNRDSLKKHELLTEVLIYKIPTYMGCHKVIKSIVQPLLVKEIHDPHSFFYVSGFYAVNSNKEPLQQGYLCHKEIILDQIRINHYWFGTRDWFVNNKLPRRAKWGMTFTPERLEEVIDGANIEKDEIMHKFIPALKKAMFSSY